MRGVDGLVLDQVFRKLLQQVPVTDQQVLGIVVGLVDYPPDLFVDLEGDLVGVVRLLIEVPSHEYLSLGVAQGQRTELLAHAVAGDHLLGGLRYALQVVGCSGGDLIINHALGRPAAEHHGELRHQLSPAHHETVFRRQAHRDA